ncbi:hypothetical protein BKA62DRAFT_688775 [Auriculariales sp. MPI-PUGE-AT-0066]|nr:hypothetical protein BKA62DRAFT_688775 [Auriculariales sp. MPI-PUGE-AT-0066]
MAAADASFNCNLWLLTSILYLCEPATSQLLAAALNFHEVTKRLKKEDSAASRLIYYVFLSRCFYPIVTIGY